MPLISSIIRTVQRLVTAVAVVANVGGALVVLCLVALINSDVFAREVLHAPIKGVAELVIFSMILIVFLQLPDVVRTNRLTRSEGVLSGFFSDRPTIADVANRVLDAMAFAFMVMIAWTVWPEFFEAFETCHFFSQPDFGPPPTGDLFVDLTAASKRCEYFGTPGIFTAPWWPARLAIAFGVTLAAVVFGLKTLFGDPLKNQTHSDMDEDETT